MIKKYKLKVNAKLITHYTLEWSKNGSKHVSKKIAQFKDFPIGFEVRQNLEWSTNYYGKNISFKPEQIENNNWELVKEMKEEFILPELYYVKCNKEEAKIFKNWYHSTKEHRYGELSWDIQYIPNDTAKNFYLTRDEPSDYPVITFDQFKKYVLKEDVKESVVKLNTTPEMFSLDTIKAKLSKYYDKDDVKDISETITK